MLRFVVARRGREGWVVLARKSERLVELVVGRAKGNGIISLEGLFGGRVLGDD